MWFVYKAEGLVLCVGSSSYPIEVGSERQAIVFLTYCLSGMYNLSNLVQRLSENTQEEITHSDFTRAARVFVDQRDAALIALPLLVRESYYVHCSKCPALTTTELNLSARGLKRAILFDPQSIVLFSGRHFGSCPLYEESMQQFKVNATAYSALSAEKAKLLELSANFEEDWAALNNVLGSMDLEPLPHTTTFLEA